MIMARRILIWFVQRCVSYHFVISFALCFVILTSLIVYQLNIVEQGKLSRSHRKDSDFDEYLNILYDYTWKKPIVKSSFNSDLESIDTRKFLGRSKLKWNQGAGSDLLKGKFVNRADDRMGDVYPYDKDFDITNRKSVREKFKHDTINQHKQAMENNVKNGKEMVNLEDFVVLKEKKHDTRRHNMAMLDIADDTEMERKIERNVHEGDSRSELQGIIEEVSLLLGELDKAALKIDEEELLDDNYNEGGNVSLTFDPLLYPEQMDLRNILDLYLRNGSLPDNQINKWKYMSKVNPSTKCTNDSQSISTILVLFIVKTRADHFLKRRIIRSTWADEKKFPMTRTVFTIGSFSNVTTRINLRLESEVYKDIVIDDYEDTALTLKTIAGINWAAKNCLVAQYVISVSDDMYVATDFLLQYLKGLHPVKHKRLYAGYVYKDSQPVRSNNVKDYESGHRIVSKQEYPFSTYPDHVFGGFIIMSMRTVMELNLAIPYTKMFKFPDIYIGIVASRLGIIPIETDLVTSSISYYNSEKFKSLIASPGYVSSELLQRTWECHLSSIERNTTKLIYCQSVRSQLEKIHKKFDFIHDLLNRI